MMRCLSMRSGDLLVGLGVCADLRGGLSVPALAKPKCANRLVKGFLVELGPQTIAEEQLRISALPQQEIRETLFSPGADEQVWIRHVGQGHGRVKIGFGQDVAACHDGSGGFGDVPATTVVKAYVQHKT